MVFTANAAVSWSVPTDTHPVLVPTSYTPYGLALPSSGSTNVHLDRLGLALGLPLLALVLEGPDQFFLLGVHADHRVAGGEMLGGAVVEVGELGVTVRVIRPLDRFDVGLQAESLGLEEFRHRRWRNLVPRSRHRFGQPAHRFRRPPAVLRIAPRAGLDQRQQRRDHARIGLGDRFAAPAPDGGSAAAARRRTPARPPPSTPSPRSCRRRPRRP